MLGKQRWRNYSLWISVISQVILFLQLIGHLTGQFDISEALKNDYILVADVFLGILATLGIISNPTNPEKKGFSL